MTAELFIAHVGTGYRVYATETGIDRTYFEPPFRKPRPAIDYSDELAGLPGRHRSPDLAGLLGAESRDEVAVPTEAPDRTQDASVCAGCGGPLQSGRHGQRRLTCSVACRERARYHRAAKRAGADEQAQGQNLTPSRPSGPDRTARFWAKVDTSGGMEACWPWTGARSQKGYGIVSLGARHRRVLANRVALEIKLGRPIAPGLFACHTCDNPPCCNPAHLFEGTHAQNMADMAGKARSGRTTKPEAYSRLLGEGNHASRLTADQVRDIRARYAAGAASQTALAAEYRISQASVSALCLRQTWSHLEQPDL